MFRFNKVYFTCTALLFVIEVLIALYVRDRFVRPYVGDVLVVILIYCFIRSFLRWSVRAVAIGTLLFAFLIEGLQYLHLVTLLGLKHNEFARIVIGTDFAWEDILAYIMGVSIVVLAEFVFSKGNEHE